MTPEQYKILLSELDPNQGMPIAAWVGGVLGLIVGRSLVGALVGFGTGYAYGYYNRAQEYGQTLIEARAAGVAV